VPKSAGPSVLQVGGLVPPVVMVVLQWTATETTVEAMIT